MALTIAGAVVQESPNRLRFSATGGTAAGTETVNLVTLAGLGGGPTAADIALFTSLLARVGLAQAGETDAHVRSCLHARIVRGSRTAPAANTMGMNCDLGAPGGVPTLTVGMTGTGAADNAAVTVEVEINHSIAQ